MRIEIIDVKTESKGKYRVANVNFKNTDTGRVDGKKVMSFTFKEVFKTLSESKQGDIFDVKAQKNDAGFWDWIEVSAEGKNVAAEGTSPQRTTSASRSTFETPEERAKKQVYIVRQSSVSSAIEYLKAIGKGKEFDIPCVIATAKEFEQYVFDVSPVEVEVS